MLKNTKYYKFLKEHSGAELFEDEKCFVTYSVNDGVFYINDIYVEPEYREPKIIAEYFNMLCSMAKGQGCSKVHGFADKMSRTPNKSRALFRLLGFSKVKSTEDFDHYERDV